jgi:hypothetical protein
MIPKRTISMWPSKLPITNYQLQIAVITPAGDAGHGTVWQSGPDYSQRCPVPILFMALLALALFLVMGGLVFYAAYAEGHTAHKDDAAKPAARP